jgi:hypothetical protein
MSGKPKLWVTDQQHYTLLSLAPTNWLSFPACGLRINMDTGQVVIPDGLTLDEASRQFWEQLCRFHPRAPVGFGER